MLIDWTTGYWTIMTTSPWALALGLSHWLAHEFLDGQSTYTMPWGPKDPPTMSQDSLRYTIPHVAPQIVSVGCPSQCQLHSPL